MKFNYYNGRTEEQFIYIAKPGKKLLGVLNGVDPSSIVLTRNANNTDELVFDVKRYLDRLIDEPDEMSNGMKNEKIQSAYYDYIDELMEIYVDGTWFLINSAPQINNDGYEETKSVTCESLEIELQKYDLELFETGTGTEQSYEMMYIEEFGMIKHNVGGEVIEDYPVITFCNKQNPRLSLLHLALYHAGLIPSTPYVKENGEIGYDWVSNIDKSPWQIGEIDENPRYVENLDGSQTAVALANDVYSFQIDNQDLYSFLTQEVAGAFRCIFLFDTVNCTINAKYVENIGTDTNVFLGWRNIQNSLAATREEQLYTAMTVKGGEGIDSLRFANFGEDELLDYSYFMNSKYVDLSLIEKYNSWMRHRDGLRQEYMDTVKDYMNNLNKYTEIEYRLPSDRVSQSWAYMSADDLMQSYNDYNMMISGYENTYVDENNNFDMEALKNSPDWKSYHEIKTYILPQIINALAKKQDDITDKVQDITNLGTGNLLRNATFTTTEGWINMDGGSKFSTYNMDDSVSIRGKVRYHYYIEETPTLDNYPANTFYSSYKAQEGLKVNTGLIIGMADFNNYVSKIAYVYTQDTYYIFESKGNNNYGWRQLSDLEIRQRVDDTQDIVISPGESPEFGIRQYLHIEKKDVVNPNLQYGLRQEGIQTNKSQPYTFSVYARTTSPNAKLRLNVGVSTPNKTGSIPITEEEVPSIDENLPIREEILPEFDVEVAGISPLLADDVEEEIPPADVKYEQIVLQPRQYYKFENNENVFNLVDTWQKYSVTFNSPGDFIFIEIEYFFDTEDSGFGSSNYIDVCGAMLEAGTKRSTFNYFILTEDTIKAYETDWDLYGISELEIFKAKYEDLLKTLSKYSNDKYDPTITDLTEASWQMYHDLYSDYSRLYTECCAALEERIAEAQPFKDAYEKANDHMHDLTVKASRKGFSQAYPSNAFTPEDEETLLRLYKHTDYTNDTIVKTDLNTTDEEVNLHYRLYKDAIEELYAVSHPQYTWSDTLDNILAREEFKGLVEPLNLFNFVHIEVNDVNQFIKLRVVKISYNPCIYDGDFTIEFSTITQYKSKRNDYQVLLDNAISKAAKNSIQIGNKNDDLASFNITPEFVRNLLSTGTFGSYMSGFSNGLVSVVGGSITAESITTKVLTADKATIKELQAGIVTADAITTTLLNANEIFANSATINKFNAYIGNIASAYINTAAIKEAVIKDLSVGDLKASDIVVSDQLRIVSDNNALVMNGENIQFYYKDENGNATNKIGVSIGFTEITKLDENGNRVVVQDKDNPSLYIADKDGNLILTSSGITKFAIEDELIVNPMIKEGTIESDRLKFHVDTDESGQNVIISNMWIDASGTKFGTRFTEFQDKLVSGNENLIRNSKTMEYPDYSF